jgi:hypothetical protein
MNATETARQMTELDAKTPVEIDTVLAELDGEYEALAQKLTGLLFVLHRVAGDTQNRVEDGRKVHYVWVMNDGDAIEAALENVAAGNWGDAGNLARATQTVTDWGQANEALTANRREARRLNTEWHRRHWARYIQAGAAGHVHHDIDCAGGTLDRGFYRTQRNWRPDLSGIGVAEAITSLGDWAYTLCSFCFPGAPTPERPVDPDRCVYSGRWVPETVQDKEFRTMSKWAHCPACDRRRSLTPALNYRNHDTPAAEARKLTEKAQAQGKIVVGVAPNAVIKTVRGTELQASDPYARGYERECAIVALAAHREQPVELVREWADAKRKQRAL